MGRVSRVLPGMQAAFVDIGLERAAFLYVTDFFDEYGDVFNAREVEEERKKSRGRRPQIQDLLKEGQEVLVQIAKDPIGTKGARLTSHVSLPGRHLVYMPTVEHTGVSRKIEEDDERNVFVRSLAKHKQWKVDLSSEQQLDISPRDISSPTSNNLNDNGKKFWNVERKFKLQR